jgi:hypothetical protein
LRNRETESKEKIRDLGTTGQKFSRKELRKEDEDIKRVEAGA